MVQIDLGHFPESTGWETEKRAAWATLENSHCGSGLVPNVIGQS